MHTINAIYDNEYYEDNFCGLRLKEKRAMWVKKRNYSNEEYL